MRPSSSGPAEPSSPTIPSSPDPSAVAAPFSGPPEHEVKYILPPARVAAVAAWLRARTWPDPRHPEGVVVSVYFDDREFRSLREKVNSDFLKTKVRVRWYEPVAGGGPAGPAWGEVKRKVGARRFKRREPLAPGSGELATLPLTDPRWRELLAPLLDEALPGGLHPVLELRFRRQRFVAPRAGCRVSLDRGVRVTRTNPMMLPGTAMPPLPWAVLEVKGDRRRLPPSLRPLGAMGCRRESLSKYERCYLHVTGRTVI